MSQYLKGIVAAIVAVGTAVLAVIPSGPITAAGWIQIVIAVLGAVSVYVVPNASAPRGGKVPNRM